MAQDTRKDPRAKVLTMTVRYKSATLDEFIEHHSHDVSRGGMFIKTPSPFPPGTLLKFEVKIAEDQKVMQGVGRVVWKRESSEADSDERPAGMGVKFIKIDGESKSLIDQLVTTRGEGDSAFEEGQEGGAAATPAAAAPSEKPAASSKPAESEKPAAKPAESVKPAAEKKSGGPIRKATMIGLGAIGTSQPPEGKKDEEPEEEKEPEAEKQGESFFPKTESEQEMPPPEDRTVMKQAAELLEDALKEAGGSMDEVGEQKKAEPAEEKKEEKKADKPAEEKKEEKGAEKKEEKGAEKKEEKAPESTSQEARRAEARAQARGRRCATRREAGGRRRQDGLAATGCSGRRHRAVFPDQAEDAPCYRADRRAQRRDAHRAGRNRNG